MINLPVIATGNHTFNFTAIDYNNAESQSATYTIPVGTELPPHIPVSIISTYKLNSISSAVTIPGLLTAGSTPDKFRISSLPPALQGTLYYSDTPVGTKTPVSPSVSTELLPAQAQNLWFKPAKGFNGIFEFLFTSGTTNSFGTTYSTSLATYKIPVLPDHDGDAIWDRADQDCDKDGIPDEAEVFGGNPTHDHDEDWVPDYKDIDYPGFADINSDGIHDLFDTDLDGIINPFDLDADNDGIPDQLEGSPVAGIVNPDNSRTTQSTNAVAPMAVTGLIDTDQDGVPEFLDTDSDSDGIPDYIEAQSNSPVRITDPLDTDKDGIDDIFDAECGCAQNGLNVDPVDTDEDGIPDYQDLDSDNDTMLDFAEAFDINNNGISGDDIMSIVASYKANAPISAKGYYTEAVNNKMPSWLADQGEEGLPLFLTPGNPAYRDTDADGLVDLFDATTSGVSPVAVNYNFRNSQVITPLPVELKSFKASTDKYNVILKWETASETGSHLFEVERSIDGKQFERIGEVAAKQYSNIQQKYTFTDNAPFTGVNYYRLRQVDLDGTYKYTSTVSVKLSDVSENKLTVYPNPTTGKVTCNIEMVNVNTITIKIIDLKGQTKLTDTVNLKIDRANIEYDISFLDTGIYILLVEGDSLFLSERIEKN